MKLYITKNGQRLGPYSVPEVQDLLRAGTIAPNDYAWYEGLSGWIPLSQVPGFVTIASNPGRSYGVWIICIYTLFSVIQISFVLVYGAIAAHDSQRNFFESQGYLVYGLLAINILLKLTGATLLFMLRRPALYFFAASTALGLTMLGYNMVARHWLSVIEMRGLIIMGVEYGINIAILCYVWSLFRKGVLR